MPIVDLQRRLHEVGRVRIGVTVPMQDGRSRPKKLETFRFTSQDRRALDRVAQLYGGTVTPWAAAPIGEQFEVITDTAEIRVAVPPERMGLSQSYELWSGGGCVRRCDGQRQTTDEPCVCVTLDDEDTQTPRCTRHTRLSLMLADLATTGLWRLDTQGFYASEELAGAFELAQMLAQATGRALLPGWLRLEQREIRRPGQPVKRFAVPVLDLNVDMAALLGPAQAPHAPSVALPAPSPGNGHEDTLTPVPAAWEPPSLASEIQRMGEIEPAKPRKNAAASIPSTGRRPRTATEAREPSTITAADVQEVHAMAEQLHQQQVTEAKTPPPPSMPPAPITDDQSKMMFALFNQAGITDREHRLEWVRERIDRDIATSKDLTRIEASAIIDALEALPAADELSTLPEDGA